tara:strand:- start:242 stop:442 length:201 start_codon:yes stop_codon:yes gene_type:complete
LKKFKLQKYNSSHPIIFVEASDPDEACWKATYNLMRMLLDQDDSAKTRMLCKEIKGDIRVIKVSCK